MCIKYKINTNLTSNSYRIENYSTILYIKHKNSTKSTIIYLENSREMFIDSMAKAITVFNYQDVNRNLVPE